MGIDGSPWSGISAVATPRRGMNAHVEPNTQGSKMTKPELDEGYDVCTWHPDRVASVQVLTYTPGGASRWVPSCEACSEEFNSKEVRPWD